MILRQLKIQLLISLLLIFLPFSHQIDCPANSTFQTLFYSDTGSPANFGVVSPNTLIVSRYTPQVSGTIVRVGMWGHNIDGTNIPFTIVVYSDSAALPSALLTSSSGINLPKGLMETFWYDLSSPVTVTQNTAIWIGILYQNPTTLTGSPAIVYKSLSAKTVYRIGVATPPPTLSSTLSLSSSLPISYEVDLCANCPQTNTSPGCTNCNNVTNNSPCVLGTTCDPSLQIGCNNCGQCLPAGTCQCNADWKGNTCDLFGVSCPANTAFNTTIDSSFISTPITSAPSLLGANTIILNNLTVPYTGKLDKIGVVLQNIRTSVVITLAVYSDTIPFNLLAQQVNVTLNQGPAGTTQVQWFQLDNPVSVVGGSGVWVGLMSSLTLNITANEGKFAYWSRIYGLGLPAQITGRTIYQLTRSVPVAVSYQYCQNCASDYSSPGCTYCGIDGSNSVCSRIIICDPIANTGCFNGATCQNPYTCSCFVGYKGSRNCSVPSCELLNNCNGRGTCTGPNSCTCNPGYLTVGCGRPSCELVDNCSGHGSCTGPNICTCNSGWKGNNRCSAISCDAVDNCSTHGTCVSSNVCECNSTWVGTKCEIYAPTCQPGYNHTQVTITTIVNPSVTIPFTYPGSHIYLNRLISSKQTTLSQVGIWGHTTSGINATLLVYSEFTGFPSNLLSAKNISIPVQQTANAIWIPLTSLVSLNANQPYYVGFLANADIVGNFPIDTSSPYYTYSTTFLAPPTVLVDFPTRGVYTVPVSVIYTSCLKCPSFTWSDGCSKCNSTNDGVCYPSICDVSTNDGCNNNATCNGTQCVCSDGWAGIDCSFPSCLKLDDCSNHGNCTGPNQCTCEPEWNLYPNCSTFTSTPTPFPIPIPIPTNPPVTRPPITPISPTPTNPRNKLPTISRPPKPQPPDYPDEDGTTGAGERSVVSLCLIIVVVLLYIF